MDLLQDTLSRLQNRRFAELDQHLNKCLDDNPFAYHPVLQIERVDLLPSFEAWVLQFPQSYGAHLALVRSLVGVAWEARTAGRAYRVSNEQFALMTEYLKRALPYIEIGLALHKTPYALLATACWLQSAGTIKTKRDYLALAIQSAQHIELACGVLPLLNRKWSQNEHVMHRFYKEISASNWSKSERAKLDACYTIECADVRWFAEDRDQALRLVAQALAIDRSMPRVLATAARICRHWGQFDQAETYLRELIVIEPSASAFGRLGDLLDFERDDRMGAIAAYEGATLYGEGFAAACWAGRHLRFEARERASDPLLYGHIDRMLEHGMRQHAGLAFYFQATRHINNESLAFDLAKILSLLRQGARFGDGNSAYSLGLMYWHGDHGTTKNSKKAFEFFSLAEQFEEPRALAYLGRMHSRGLGTPVDFEQALAYLHEALENNPDEAIALADLARMAKLGQGQSVNIEASDGYLRRLKRVDEDQYELAYAELQGFFALMLCLIKRWFRRR
jgi:tetratricopeptide (TPR) repeat protein